MNEAKRQQERTAPAVESLSRVGIAPWVGLVLAFAGGTTDAYSYLTRNKVFANTMTGNIVMLGYYTPQGRFDVYPRYLIPILAFFLGVLVAEHVWTRGKATSLVREQAKTSFVLAVVLAVVGCLPSTLNLLATSLIACVCGVQIVIYPEVEGLAVSTTMCTANLRRTAHWLSAFGASKDPKDLGRMGYFLALNLCFALGCAVQALIVAPMGMLAILPAVAVHVALGAWLWRESSIERGKPRM